MKQTINKIEAKTQSNKALIIKLLSKKAILMFVAIVTTCKQNNKITDINVAEKWVLYIWFKWVVSTVFILTGIYLIIKYS